jgi:two-component system chemotaxis response regulator CheB
MTASPEAPAAARSGMPLRDPRPGRIRVMVVDDSVVVRGLIARIVESEPTFEVVHTAANGLMAVQRMQASPVDVVVLDIEMPVMDGLTALPQLLAAHPKTRVIIASTLSTPGAEVTLRALALGAADFIPKPTTSAGIRGSGAAGEFKRELVSKIRSLGRAGNGASVPHTAPAARAQTRPTPAPGAPTLRPLPDLRPAVLAIGASTGGPQALTTLIGRIGPIPHVPVMITQHMPPKFTAILSEHIGRAGGCTCAEGQAGEPLLPGRLYVAPGGYHMVAEGPLASPRIALNQDPPENFCRPSVDVMFRSLARVYGAGVLAVVLTGIGCDGTAGGRAIVERGGAVLAQDEASSVVWGMPGSATRAGLSSLVLPLPELADRIGALLARRTS